MSCPGLAVGGSSAVKEGTQDEGKINSLLFFSSILSQDHYSNFPSSSFPSLSLIQSHSEASHGRNITFCRWIPLFVNDRFSICFLEIEQPSKNHTVGGRVVKRRWNFCTKKVRGDGEERERGERLKVRRERFPVSEFILCYSCFLP